MLDEARSGDALLSFGVEEVDMVCIDGEGDALPRLDAHVGVQPHGGAEGDGSPRAASASRAAAAAWGKTIPAH